MDRFEEEFSNYIGARYSFLLNSGTAALFAILKSIKRLSPDRDEVILPAYTVPTLTLAINALGLKTRLCDINASTFNIDTASLQRSITHKTLAVVGAHMFGFLYHADEVRWFCEKEGVFLIDDAAQAPGAELLGKKAGTMGHAGLFSLCKGKNISTFTGGIAVTDRTDIADGIRESIELLPENSRLYRIKLPILLLAFSLAMRPSINGSFFPIISRFKSTTVHQNFFPCKFNGFQASLARRQLAMLDRINRARTDIGMTLYERLKKKDGILLPKIIEGSKPTFNHLPVVFKRIEDIDSVQKKLLSWGIDTARMYLRPIHKVYNLGYSMREDPFPNASYIAPRLLTLPTHPDVTEKYIERIIKAFANL